MNYSEIEGDLIKLALSGEFDVISHGCNCFCQMGAGIAPQMAKAFGCDKFLMEMPEYKGDINKLGQIDFEEVTLKPYSGDNSETLIVVNSYTQYHFGHKHGIPFDPEAFQLCMRKINHLFKGKHIGLPKIGAGLAGGDWEAIKFVIQKELKDMQVTIVIYKP